MERPGRPWRRTERRKQGQPNRQKGISDLSDIVLKEEMKRRKYKVRGKSRGEIILLLEEDSRTQRQINWVKGDNGEVKCHRIRGMEEVVEEGKGDGGAQGCSKEEEEAEWEDVELLGRIGPGKET